MAAFVLVLAAGMAAGDGPGRVSGETEQGLDLRGMWDGVMVNFAGELDVVSGKTFTEKDYQDQGKGRCRMTSGRFTLLGIYKQDGDRLVLCLALKRGQRPTSFWGGKGQQHLLTLRRVKPGK